MKGITDFVVVGLGFWRRNGTKKVAGVTSQLNVLHSLLQRSLSGVNSCHKHRRNVFSQEGTS